MVEKKYNSVCVCVCVPSAAGVQSTEAARGQKEVSQTDRLTDVI